MKAIEFVTKLKNNTIIIPENLQEQLKSSEEKTVRVIVLVGSSDIQEDKEYRNMVREEFLNGCDDADSVYDKT